MPKGSIYGVGTHKRYTGKVSNAKGTYSQDIESGTHVRYEERKDGVYGFHKTAPQALGVIAKRKANRGR